MSLAIVARFFSCALILICLAGVASAAERNCSSCGGDCRGISNPSAKCRLNVNGTCQKDGSAICESGCSCNSAGIKKGACSCS